MALTDRPVIVWRAAIAGSAFITIDDAAADRLAPLAAAAGYVRAGCAFASWSDFAAGRLREQAAIAGLALREGGETLPDAL
jgi:hypothetical protein